MLEWLPRIALLIGAGVLWFAGLQLFLRSTLSRGRKMGWTAFLVMAGSGIGVLFPLSQLWTKFVLLILILPVLALADVLLFRSGRKLSFWVRACGFELCTVFGVAAVVRLFLDLVWTAAVLRPVH